MQKLFVSVNDVLGLEFTILVQYLFQAKESRSTKTQMAVKLRLLKGCSFRPLITKSRGNIRTNS
jgi:hypothetical protein